MAGSTIAAEYKEDVTLLKSLINMFNVVTDDIGDEDNDIQLLHKIEADLFASVDSEAKAVDFGSDDPQFKFCHELATRIWATARKLPRFTELAEILEYDIRQVWCLVVVVVVVVFKGGREGGGQFRLGSEHGVMCRCSMRSVTAP